MRDVAIVGAHMLKFGRYPDKDVVRLGSEAVLGALKDAGCTIKDIEVLVSGNLYQSNAGIGQRIMKEVGATGIPVINVANACATGSTAFRDAWLSVASGAYDVALAVGSEQMGKMGLLGAGGGGDRAYSTEGVMGTGLMPGVFGQAGVEHMRKYGTTQEQFAKVAVKNHEHGVHNPVRPVSDGDPARRRHERAPRRVAKHSVHVLPDGRRRGGGDPHVGGEGEAVHDEACLGRRFSPHLRSVAGAQPDDVRHQHPDARGRQGSVRRRPASGPRTSARSSCTTASRPPSSSTTRTSASAAKAKPAR